MLVFDEVPCYHPINLVDCNCNVNLLKAYIWLTFYDIKEVYCQVWNLYKFVNGNCNTNSYVFSILSETETLVYGGEMIRWRILLENKTIKNVYKFINGNCNTNLYVFVWVEYQSKCYIKNLYKYCLHYYMRC